MNREEAQIIVNDRLRARIDEETVKNVDLPDIGEIEIHLDAIRAMSELTSYMRKYNDARNTARQELLKTEYSNMMIEAGFVRCTDAKGWVYSPT